MRSVLVLSRHAAGAVPHGDIRRGPTEDDSGVGGYGEKQAKDETSWEGGGKKGKSSGGVVGEPTGPGTKTVQAGLSRVWPDTRAG